LEHVPDVHQALLELKRIIKKDGFVMLSVPTDYQYDSTYEDTDNSLSIPDRIALFGQDDHLRIFGKDFPEVLKKAGFEVEVLDGSNFEDRFGFKVGPGDYDDNKVYICKK